MELLCPECMGALEITHGGSARCTLHGGEFEIMFLRGQVTQTQSAPAVSRPQVPAKQSDSFSCPNCGQRYRNDSKLMGHNVKCSKCLTEFQAPAAMAELVSADSGREANPYQVSQSTCVRHPSVPTDVHCSSCGVAICDTCAFPQSDGRRLCPECAQRPSFLPPGFTPAPEVPSGVHCAWHADVQAVHYCKACRKPVCPTCDFTLAGNVHVCPDCATKPQQNISSKRKSKITWSFVTAIISTVCFAIMLGGIAVEAAELVFTLVVFASLFGTGIAVSALERRLVNPPSLWIAVIWNSILLALCLLFMLIGALML